MSLIYPFPVLHPESLDYENPNAYTAEMKRVDATSIHIAHEIKRDNLVSDLLEQDAAAFFVTVAVSGTVYRKTETAQKFEPHTDKIRAKQDIIIPAFRNNPTVSANCGIVALRDVKLDSDRVRGITEFFRDEKSFTFPAHSVLAYRGWRRFFGLNALFRIINDQEIKNNGEFKCELYTSDSFRIDIRMGRMLYDAVERDKNGKERAHVLCSALTWVLQDLWKAHKQLLEENPDEVDNHMLEQAQDLKRYLINKDIPTWEDDDFNAVYAASKCYPAIVEEDIQD